MSHTARAVVLSSLLILATGCTQLESPDVLVTNISPIESSGLEFRFRFDLRVVNPNDREFNVRGLDVKLDVNGQRLARGVSGEPFVVPAFGEAQTSVDASTTIFDIARPLLTMGGQTEIAYELRGKMHLEGVFPGTLSFEKAASLDLANPGGFGGEGEVADFAE